MFKYFGIWMGVSLILLSSCKKNDADQWLKDNIEVIGKIPVITSLAVVPPQTVSVQAGSVVNLDLRYWSEDEIDQINFRDSVGTTVKKLFLNKPYQKAYSTVSRTDSLLAPYQVPAGLASNTKIIIEAEVVNKNSLKKVSTLTLTVK